jgi:hypothetical protein
MKIAPVGRTRITTLLVTLLLPLSTFVPTQAYGTVSKAVNSSQSPKSGTAQLIKKSGFPLTLTRVIHPNTNVQLGALGKERFRHEASLYFWQGDANRLLLFKPDFSDFKFENRFAFTPFVSGPGNKFFTIGDCVSYFLGGGNCESIIQDDEGVIERVPSPGFLDNHDLTRDSKDNFWAIRYTPFPCKYFPEFCLPNYFGVKSDKSSLGDRSPEMVVDCEIVRINPAGRITYRWSALQNLPPTEVRWNWYTDNLSKTSFLQTGYDGVKYIDPIHCNSINLNSDESRFLISARNTDAVYEVDINEKLVTAKVGGNFWKGKTVPLFEVKNKKILKMKEPLSGQHDARYLDDGIISIYDNSTNIERPARGLLISLSGTNKGKIVKVFPNPDGTNSACTGSFRQIIGKLNWYLAGWGCTKNGATVFDDSGTPIVSLRVDQTKENEPYLPKIPIQNTETMLSYRVIPSTRS